MDGRLAPLIDALALADIQEKLNGGERGDV
jgi:hypothetical protein